MFVFKYDFDLGGEQDTGQKTSAGNAIYAKLLDTGALPNATSKNVAHGLDDISVAAGAYFGLLASFADDGGTTLSTFDGITGLTWGITDTNLVLTAAGDLSGWTGSSAVILYEKDDLAVS